MESRNKSLYKLFKRRDKIDLPEYQRGKVWTKEKKQKFVDTILKGWHVPKLYFRVIEATDQSFECVDGQQRLNAIFEFYGNKLLLPEKSRTEYGGLTFETLKPEYSDKFDDYEFQIEEIESASDEELEELFLRLQLGTPLNTAEKLNAIGGDLRNFIKELARCNFFKEAIRVKDTRFAHFVICCRFLYLEIYKIPTKLRQAELEKMLQTNKKFSITSLAANKAKLKLDILHDIFKNDPKILSNRANIVSCYYLISQFQDLEYFKKNSNELRKLKEYFVTFFNMFRREIEKGSKAINKELLDYQDAISRNTDSRESINKRNEVLLKYLLILKPSLFQKLNLSLQNQVKIIVDGSVENIFDLILRANDNYTKKRGEQKFKFTSENVRAQKKLKKFILDDKTFKEIIDSLYKLLYEGSSNGSRLNSSEAEVIKDIKLLRTDLDHDWEHGKKGDIKRKAKKIADTYLKYTGKNSLSLLDVDDFKKFQFVLYAKIIKFLKNEVM